MHKPLKVIIGSFCPLICLSSCINLYIDKPICNLKQESTHLKVESIHITSIKAYHSKRELKNDLNCIITPQLYWNFNFSKNDYVFLHLVMGTMPSDVDGLGFQVYSTAIQDNKCYITMSISSEPSLCMIDYVETFIPFSKSTLDFVDEFVLLPFVIRHSINEFL